ncbi:MAG: hypothetical protein IT379_00560 [Deltaproteobacteria bacterium]|nr:hypothetical protein [Deltaproteobacteria bacterium]
MATMIAGELSPRVRQRLAAVLDANGLAPQHCVTLDGARARLSAEPLPTALLMPIESTGARRFLSWLRSQQRLGALTVLGIVDWPSEEDFQRAFAAGVDDVVVEDDESGVLRRIRALASRAHRAEGRSASGRCLVQHPDQPRRASLGRALRQAGYDVTFACSLEEVLDRLVLDPPGVVLVAEPQLWESVAQAIEEARRVSERPDLPFVVCVSELDAARLRASSTPVLNVSLMQTQAGPSDALFLVNRLLSSAVESNGRSSARILYDTFCSIRPLDEPGTSRYAMTFNVSRGGLYVRTFDPVPRGSLVQLKLRPPSVGSTVELVGRVAWTCAPGNGPTVTAPPGFGVELLRGECLAAEWTRYQTAVALAEHESTVEFPFVRLRADDDECAPEEAPRIAGVA